MKKYKKEDFENMIFNPYPYTKGRDILDLYPDLRNHDEFSNEVEEIDKTQLLTYIFLMYDKESPLVINITDLDKRKDEALELAGFSRRNGKWNLTISEFRNLENTDVNKVISKFFFIQHANKFEFMVSLEEAYYQMCQELRNPIDGDDAEERLKSLKIKGAVAKEAAGISNDIDELRRGIFKEDKKTGEVVEEEAHEQRVVAGIREQRARKNLKVV